MINPATEEELKELDKVLRAHKEAQELLSEAARHYLKAKATSTWRYAFFLSLCVNVVLVLLWVGGAL